MAKREGRRRPSMRDVQAMIEWATYERVTVDSRGEHITLSIATNTDLELEEIVYEDVFDSRVGAAPDGAECYIAQHAIVRRFLEVIAPPRLSLREWILREREKRARKYGERNAMSALVADLLGWELTDQARREKVFKSERRALERLITQGKEKHKGTGRMSRERQERIANLPGGEEGNPFLSLPSLARSATGRYALRFGVVGRWTISRDHYVKVKHTEELRSYSPLHRVVRDAPADFIDTTIADLARHMAIMPILDECRGLIIYARRVKK